MFLIPDTHWEIKDTKEKGLGVFCMQNIAAGTVISDYLGTVINTAEYDLDTDKKGLYLMYFSDTRSIYPDLTKPGPHLLNHSCRPNCWIYIYRGHTLFFALRDIHPGEELTISYLLDPDRQNCISCTHMCKCESERCTRTMHLSNNAFNLWQKFQKERSGKTRRSASRVGDQLSKLHTYPKKISIHPIYQLIQQSSGQKG